MSCPLAWGAHLPIWHSQLIVILVFLWIYGFAQAGLLNDVKFAIVALFEADESIDKVVTADGGSALHAAAANGVCRTDSRHITFEQACNVLKTTVEPPFLVGCSVAQKLYRFTHYSYYCKRLICVVSCHFWQAAVRWWIF
jgi:hypothetical protein